MRTARKRGSWTGYAFGGLVTVFGVACAHGALLLNESFAEPMGGLPPGWEVVTAEGVPTTNPPQIADGDGVRFQIRADADDPQAGIFYGKEKIQDLEASAVFTIRSLRRVTMGFYIRAATLDYLPANGYTVVVGNRETGNHRWFIGIFPSEVRGDFRRNRALVWQDFPDQQASYSGPHELRVAALGDTVTASFWTSGGREIASVTLEGAERTDAGYFGIHGEIQPHRVRTFYVRDLALLPDPAAKASLELLEALDSDDPGILQKAMDALAERDGGDVPLMTRQLREADDEEMRTAAAQTLALIGGDAVIPALCDALQDPAVAVRSQALAALGARLPARESDAVLSEALPALWAALEDVEPDIRGQAAEILGEVFSGRGPAGGADMERTLALLRARLRDEAAVQGPAVAALSRIGGPQVREALEEAGFRDDWPQWRFDAARTASTPFALPEELHLQWVHELAAPRRAWPPQADDLDRLEFDLSHPFIVYRDTVIISLTSNDSLLALNLTDGTEQWRFYGEAPFRLAAAAGNGRAYAVSDDGYLY